MRWLVWIAQEDVALELAVMRDLLEGKPVKRLKVDEVIHGNPSGMVLVMDFDSAEAITEMFESDDYAALVPVRDRGFSEMNIMLTHDM